LKGIYEIYANILEEYIYIKLCEQEARIFQVIPDISSGLQNDVQLFPYSYNSAISEK